MTKDDDAAAWANALQAIKTAKLVMGGEVATLAPMGWDIVVDALRKAEAALAPKPAPVDPLEQVMRDAGAALAARHNYTPDYRLLSEYVAELRKLGVTLDPTRERGEGA